MTQPMPMTKRPREALILHIELQDITPPIWRRFAVPRNVTLGRLHHVIQIVMGWVDYHLHDFEIAGKRYSAPDPEDLSIIPETRLRLLKALGAEGTFTYLYDFGDDWYHRIKVEDIVPADAYAQAFYCIEGANACPPEDVGGPHGYEVFLAALANRRHPEHRLRTQWYGRTFDISAFDRESVNQRLKRFR